jgi:hypothetical protein
MDVVMCLVLMFGGVGLYHVDQLLMADLLSAWLG